MNNPPFFTTCLCNRKDKNQARFLKVKRRKSKSSPAASHREVVCSNNALWIRHLSVREVLTEFFIDQLLKVFTQFVIYIGALKCTSCSSSISSSSSSSRADLWVHFQQNAGLRLFVHPWSVHDIDDCYQFTLALTFGGPIFCISCSWVHCSAANNFTWEHFLIG